MAGLLETHSDVSECSLINFVWMRRVLLQWELIPSHWSDTQHT